MIDLTPFCLTIEDKFARGHPRMRKPWNYGPFTWASDGAIVVRVAARPSVTMADIKTDKMWEQYPTGKATWEKVMIADIGDAYGVALGHWVFNGKYFNILSTLPDLEFAVDYGSVVDALPFRFAGGCGLLMPLKSDVPFDVALRRTHRNVRSTK